jgi:asparagine synthase (glutamine-hydrolysing)
MCGICGFIGPYNNQDLELITNKIIHRGPDDSGYFFSQTSFGKNIGLGHRRLSIIDMGTGHQPIWNEKKTKCIIFNGEIYNYQLLRKKLVNLGHSFSTKSDTEVILHGYESYGSDFVQQLEGMFAFAI